MLADAAISLFCSFALFVVIWLMLPIFVLPPVAFYFGFRFYKKMVARFNDSAVLARLVGAIPMAIAVASVPAALTFVSSTYQA